MSTADKIKLGLVYGLGYALVVIGLAYAMAYHPS